jgi:hypothetical protein
MYHYHKARREECQMMILFKHSFLHISLVEPRTIAKWNYSSVMPAQQLGGMRREESVLLAFEFTRVLKKGWLNI